MTRPVIGLCAAVVRARWTHWEDEAALLSMASVRQVRRAGGVALPLPPQDDAGEVLELLDGLVLTRGADIGNAPERDAFELALAAEGHPTKSHRHQGADRMGRGRSVTGWATVDELREAIEDPSRRFALGVQWHPEADERSPLLAALVEAAA